MTLSSGRKRVSGSHRIAAVTLVLVALISAGCSEVEPELTLDQQINQFEADLVADGVELDVATCVSRLAEHDLRSGALDPVVLDELILNCERAEQILNRDESGEPEPDLAFTEGPFTLGDDADLDGLWQECADGSGAACDRLFESSPVGSEYEEFGVTCGQRNEILNCAELDDPDSIEQ